MDVYSKSLGSVTVRSGRISGFTKLGMAMTLPGMPLSPALGPNYSFYSIFLSVYGS